MEEIKTEKKSPMIVIGLVLVFALLAFPMLSKNKKQSLPVETPNNVSGTTVPSGPVKEFTVTGGNFKFDVKEMKVKVGDTVKITFKNSEGMHDFVLDEFNVKTNVIGEGKEETVTFTADKAGTFEYYCSVGSHRKMGMVGKLIVE